MGALVLDSESSCLSTAKKISDVVLQGWFAVRRELRAPMFIFLMISVLYLAGWSVMFFSTTFRWTFVTWRFFSIMACISVFLTVISFIFGVICRFNFGKGLLRYRKLHHYLPLIRNILSLGTVSADHPLPDDDYVDDYGSSDIEKVDFPSNEKPIPTYSVTFGSGQEVPPPSQMFATRGPRFFNKLAQPFETAPVTVPPVAVTLTRKVSDGSLDSGHVKRSDTHSSQKSFGSLASYYSYSDRGHTRSDSQKRWVIE